MVVHYLYHLDYPSETVQHPHSNINGHATSLNNGDNADNAAGQPCVNGHAVPNETPKLVNGHGTHQREGSIQEDELQENGDLEDFIPGANNVTKKSKKKKKKKAAVKIDADETAVESVGSRDNDVPHKGDEMVAEDEAAQPDSALSAISPGHVAVHAKVYRLSKKYDIPELKALSLAKFETEASRDWDSRDFLEAIKEVYSPSIKDEDRTLKDLVTQIVCNHKAQLLNKPETKEAIKGLELSYDVLMSEI